MSRSIGITDFLNRSFITFPFEGKMAESFGEPERNFKAIIYGNSGHGKTEFAIKLAKYISQWTRVYYNSFEQGISKTLQDALRRNNMQDVAGRVIFGDKETFDEMLVRLSGKHSPMVVVIDSRDFINMTSQQFKILITKYPRKAFILLCWEAGGKPKGEYAKSIEFMCDIKIRVHNFQAFPRCRFGGNRPFVIWDKAPVLRKLDLFSNNANEG